MIVTITVVVYFLLVFISREEKKQSCIYFSDPRTGAVRSRATIACIGRNRAILPWRHDKDRCSLLFQRVPGWMLCT